MGAFLVAALKHTPKLGRMVMLCSTFFLTNQPWAHGDHDLSLGLRGLELSYFGYLLIPETWIDMRGRRAGTASSLVKTMNPGFWIHILMFFSILSLNFCHSSNVVSDEFPPKTIGGFTCVRGVRYVSLLGWEAVGSTQDSSPNMLEKFCCACLTSILNPHSWSLSPKIKK